ncbi:MAG: type II toxin-antitoxin system RelE/ParE family toxin [Planctomycetota bacterium]|jgi:addiction module RelE/StbE family toxin
MAKVLWTDLALEDLRSIQRYVAYDKPEAARKLAGRIRQRIRDLASHPLSGRVPELPGTGYREVIVASYRIVYGVDGKQLKVLREDGN